MVDDDVPDISAEGVLGSLFVTDEDDTMKEEAIINFVFFSHVDQRVRI